MSFLDKKIDKRLVAYQQELIETHYREVENMYQKMRGWRHDYRNHIQTMKAYAAADDLEAISIYLDELDTDLNTVDTVVKTGNSMADAILNSKISLAQSKDIPVMVDASIPVKLRMSEIDLCCIIGNLFDNAIEASLAKELDESFFRVGRGMILNLKHISRVTKKEVLLFDGTRLPLPRGAYEALNRAIIERG